MKKILDPLIGSDIEYFVRAPSGEIVSAEGHIKGTKSAPYRFSDDLYFATQLDNVLAEGNIPPCSTEDMWVNNHLVLRRAIEKQLPLGFRTEACASARLHSRYLTENARQMGCDPSFNAWTGNVIPPTMPKSFIRSAGFHVHIGYPNPSKAVNCQLMKWMDVYVGAVAALVEPVSDRHILGYGRAGNYRNQPHGAEYRVLSTFWASEPHYIRWVYRATLHAIGVYNRYCKDADMTVFLDSCAEKVNAAINARDQEAAEWLQLSFTSHLPKMEVL